MHAFLPIGLAEDELDSSGESDEEQGETLPCTVEKVTCIVLPVLYHLKAITI